MTFQIAGDCELSIKATEARLLALLGYSIKEVFKVHGRVRPGDQKGHEHFGYLDGISSPAVRGVVDPFPGQLVVDPGVLLMGQPGDPALVPLSLRPAWAKNGSILAYRQLNQLVPEFDKFKRDNHLRPLELPVEEGAELLGSRLFGRWKSGVSVLLSHCFQTNGRFKSGAPIDITPVKDDPALAKDPQRNNDFDFSDVSITLFVTKIAVVNRFTAYGSITLPIRCTYPQDKPTIGLREDSGRCRTCLSRHQPWRHSIRPGSHSGGARCEQDALRERVGFCLLSKHLGQWVQISARVYVHCDLLGLCLCG